VLVLFQRNDLSSFLILVFFVFALRLPYFLLPIDVSVLGDFYTSGVFSFHFLKDWYIAAPKIYLFLSTVVWILFAVYIKSVVVKERLLSRKDFVSAMAFVLLTSALPQFVIISVHSIAVFLVFIAFSRIISTQYNRSARAHYFFIGFILGLAFCVHWSNALFLLSSLWILLRLRIFVVQEYAALLIGFLLPIYLLTGLQYVIDGQFKFFSLFNMNIVLPTSITHPWAVAVLMLLCLILGAAGILLYRNNKSENKLQLTKKWNALLVYLFFAVLVGCFSRTFPESNWVHALLPLSIILSSAYTNNRKKYNTFTFYLSILAVLSIQWVLRLV